MVDAASGMLPEHQKAEPMSTSATGYTPSEDERKALKLVDEFLSRAKRFKQPKAEKWPDYYKMFRGKQWKEQRPSYRHSEVVNMVFQSIQSTVPIQTVSRPLIEFIAQNPSDYEFTNILNQACQADWERYNWLYQLTECVYDANFYGTGLGSMTCDPEGEDGLPQIVFESDDPFYAFPDPNARDVNGKRTRGYATAEPVDIAVLKREYPDKAKYIKPDLLDTVQLERMNLDEIKFRSPVDAKVTLEGTTAYDLAENNKALKITLWLYSDDFDEEERGATGEDGNPIVLPDGTPKVEYIQTLKYPKGRKICVASGVVLSDGANEYEDGKIPKARLTNYMVPREFWGISDIEQLESPQKIFNKVISFALDIMTLMGNPIWVVDSGSEIDTDNLVNRPGLVVEKSQGSEVRREQGIDVNPSVFQLVDRLKDWFQGVAGNQEVSQGAQPGGITAVGAINALQEAAQTRLRLKARHLDAFLQDLGQLWISRALQFYTAPRIFRLTEKQDASKFFKMHFEPKTDVFGQPEIGPDGNPKRIAVVRDYVQGADGQMTESLEARTFELSGRFDVRVGTGSSLPFAKQEKFTQAKAMFELGVIDAQELLKTADWPNWEAVLARTEAAKQQAAMAQAGAAGAPSAAPPPASAPPPAA